MAAGKWKLYEVSKLWLSDGTFDLDDGTSWQMGLYLSTSNANTLTLATPNLAAITNEHSATSTGYTTGGVALTGVGWTQTSGTGKFTCNNAQWTASTNGLAARFAIIYKNATVNTIVKPVLCVCLLDTTPADVTATNGNTLTVQIAAGGVFTTSGAATD
jgi:hypothetical protein